jgi:hypothetical protein
MKKSLSILAFILTSFVTAHAQLQTVPVENFSTAPGARADTIDRIAQEKIRRSIQDDFPDWRLESLREEKESASSTMSWVKGEQRMVVYVSYLTNAKEAAKQLRFNLATIQIPRDKPFDDLGDAAYLIKSDGPLVFTTDAMVINVCGCPAPFELVKRFARRIASRRGLEER